MLVVRLKLFLCKLNFFMKELLVLSYNSFDFLSLMRGNDTYKRKGWGRGWSWGDWKGIFE